MKAEGIDHIAINVKDLAKAEKFFSELFGIKFSSLGVTEEFDLRSSIDSFGIELVEPLTSDGPTARTIQERGEGFALLSIKVSNIQEAIDEMKSRNIRLVGMVDHPKYKAAIFHPKDTYGVMIELIDYPSDHPLVAIRHE